VESHLLEVAPELYQRLELNGMDSHDAGGCNVDFAVVDEEAIGRRNTETVQAVLIDRRVWLDQPYFR
jgi:hypothetical protein